MTAGLQAYLVRDVVERESAELLRKNINQHRRRAVGHDGIGRRLHFVQPLPSCPEPRDGRLDPGRNRGQNGSDFAPEPLAYFGS